MCTTSTSSGRTGGEVTPEPLKRHVFVEFFAHLKLRLATAIHNFKQMKMTYMSNSFETYDNLANVGPNTRFSFRLSCYEVK